ncbi:MAG TPA: hypothetical protein VM450_06325 [Thermomicrobiales bacterium]|jgi:hypothetical protein|nr:hypothetical protein [Thermomicrobiales bacterium]
MDEFDGRDFNSDDVNVPIDGSAERLAHFVPGEGLIWRPDQDPHDAFACPFCDTPVNLSIPVDEEALVADCPGCENWFTLAEWRYYKQLAIT